jgi:hypothetical protein
LELGRITRFGFVGIAATVVYVGTSFTGIEVFGIPPVAASVDPDHELSGQSLLGISSRASTSATNPPIK